jgi:4-hydroxy-3-methylbut-2-enyl diphosphate reductase IspH
MPGTTVTDNDHGVPTSVYKTAVATAAGILVADTTCELVVYSRKNATYQPVTGSACWAKWAELRSRRD